jgi:hypothetical protein
MPVKKDPPPKNPPPKKKETSEKRPAPEWSKNLERIQDLALYDPLEAIYELKLLSHKLSDDEPSPLPEAVADRAISGEDKIPPPKEKEASENRPAPEWSKTLERILAQAPYDPVEAIYELKKLSHKLSYDGPAPLPEIVVYRDISEEDKIPPPEILRGCLYQGGKILIAAASKARKTWALLDLILSVANGCDWLGIQTTRKNTLFLDLELMKFETATRLDKIRTARGIESPDGVHIWNLRGHALTLARLKPTIVDYCKEHEIGLVAFDPYYRLGEGCDENDNGEIAKFLAILEAIAHETGAAIALTHHFAKGNSGVKNSIDRMSGAGTFARDPDVVMSMTEQENSTNDNPIFVAEFTVRSFKPLPPFAISWECPRWSRDDRLGTGLKGAPGRPKSAGSAEDIVSLLEYESELRTKEWRQAAMDEYGVDRNKFYGLLKELKAAGFIDERIDGRAKFYTLNRSKAVYGKTFNLKTDHPATQAELLE